MNTLPVTLPVLLSYRKQCRSHGQQFEVTGNAVLLVDKEIVDYFAIPYSPSFERTLVLVPVKAHSRQQFLGGSPVLVSSYQRPAPGSRATYNVVRLPKGQKTCAIRFPVFFNCAMIGQALDSFLKKNQPDYWRLDRATKIRHFWEWGGTGGGGEEDSAQLATLPGPAKNQDRVPWGNASGLHVVHPVTPRPRKKKT